MKEKKKFYFKCIYNQIETQKLLFNRKIGFHFKYKLIEIQFPSSLSLKFHSID